MSHWIKLHKSIAENPYWTAETFSRGQAWVDMLLLANKAPGFVRKQGMRVELDRGDLGWSEVELSKRWQWSRGKVRRFLDELENDGMICRKNGTETDRRKFVITIVNYCKYQDKQAGDATGERTGDGQATVQEERVTEEQNTPPPARAHVANNEPIQMSPEWEPSEFFPTIAATSGLVLPPKGEVEEAAMEFRSFWITQNRKRTPHEWDHAFVKAIKFGFSSPRGRPQSGNSGAEKIQPRTIRDALTIQGEEIARALNEDNRRRQQQAGPQHGKTGGVLMEH